MRIFEMCPECAEEYHDPRNRRFHAQPKACPKCGPQMELWDENGHVVAHGYESLNRAVIAICDGLIVAVKGLGGFHLMVDASKRLGGPPAALPQATRRKALRTDVSLVENSHQTRAG